MEVSLAIVYSIRNTRAPPWSYPPTTGNGIFLLYRRIHLCLLKLLETKNTLPLLIVLPLNMVSAVGKISRRLPAESTRILLPFPRRFGVTFSGFLDLDDLGSHVGQDHARKGHGAQAVELDDTQAGQRFHVL